MQDAWRAYLELAMGLTEAPRKKAQDVTRRLVGSGGATAAQLQALAEELISTGSANREALTKLIRFEVDRTLGVVGLATADEVAELTRRVHELERQLREAKAAPGPLLATAAAPAAPADRPRPGAASVPDQAAPTAPVRKVVAKKTVAKKAVVMKSPPTVTPAPAGDVADATPAKVAPAAKKVAAKKVAGRRPTPGGAA